MQRAWRPGDGEASVRETLSCVIYLSGMLGSLALVWTHRKKRTGTHLSDEV